MPLDRGDVVLVTGASTGIGLALVRALLKHPCRIIATARPSSLERFAEAGLHESEQLRFLALDLESPPQIQSAAQQALDIWGRVDVLVNNAGISYRSVVEHMTVEDESRQMQTNYLGPMQLIRAVLPQMRAQKKGRIVNVSSVGGMMAMPTMASYSASKFALEGASEALWYELKPFGIRVTLIQPGFVHSNAFHHVYFPKSISADGALLPNASPYFPYYHYMGRFISRFMNLTRSSSETVAHHIVKSLLDNKPPLRVPATPDAVLFWYVRRLLPRQLYHRVLYRLLPGIRHWGHT